jgi:hypothetical protein
MAPVAENPYLVNPRWAVADLVGNEVRRRYPADILAIGVHGSLAHGDDTDLSDVDLVVVTHRAQAGPSASARRIDGVIVDIGVIASEEYLQHARTLSMSWPLAADRYVTTKPLFDPEGWFDRLRDTHLARLADAGGHEFTALAREAWCRGASAHAKATRLATWHETDAALVALSEARVSAAIVKGLLTRTYFRNSADAVRRTGIAGADIVQLGAILAGQADELARRGRPVDGEVEDLFL